MKWTTTTSTIARPPHGIGKALRRRRCTSRTHTHTQIPIYVLKSYKSMQGARARVSSNPARKKICTQKTYIFLYAHTFIMNIFMWVCAHSVRMLLHIQSGVFFSLHPSTVHTLRFILGFLCVKSGLCIRSGVERARTPRVNITS